MQALVLYKPHSEHARSIEEFNREFTHRTPHQLTLVDVDTAEGAAQAELYDVVQYPTILAIRDDGQLVKSWVGETLPTINDVAGYLVEH